MGAKAPRRLTKEDIKKKPRLVPPPPPPKTRKIQGENVTASIPQGDTLFCPSDKEWPKINRRRCELIRREVDGLITPEEAEELERLQSIADQRIDAVAPIDLTELDRLYDEMQKRKDHR